MHHQGISQAEALQLLAHSGFNELPSQKSRSWFFIFLGVLKEPMLFFLLVIGLIYLILGERQDAGLLMSAVLLVIGITFYQEKKTENALAALKNLSSPRALVIRDGQQVRIPGREVVVGDLLVLQEGDRVAADAQVLESVNLLVDESLLTGESLPVRKSEYQVADLPSQPGGDNTPFIYSGTLITLGHGLARVTYTGITTQMGRIGTSLQTVVEPETLLKTEIRKMIKIVGLFGLLACLIVILIFGLGRGLWLQGLLSGLTLSMSLLPEEFSVVLVLFLTLGAWRMSRYQVLTRNTSVVETLGAATVLCVDKTGTITQNQMQLQTLVLPDSVFRLSSKTAKVPEKFHRLIEYAALSSQPQTSDPLEKEIFRSDTDYLTDGQHQHPDWQLVKEYTLSKQLMAISHVWKSPDSRSYIIAAKGAPEAIADLCHLTLKQKIKLDQQIVRLAASGLRLIGVAKATYSGGKFPESQHDFHFEFIGLLGFADPIRPEVSAAVSLAIRAGLKIIMITGDYPGTAQYIAGQIGLPSHANILTGPQLAAMPPARLQEFVDRTDIFARVIPEQKLLIVNALKNRGHIVAMTGDGVNDAPALKTANIGIAMGRRGTDVAREAADLVLLDDNFASIVRAVEMGRRIFANLQKAVSFILAVHIPIGGMALLPILFGSPPFLLPAHIAFLELIIDPACTLVFESERSETGIMNQPPRRLSQSLIGPKQLSYSLLQGLLVLVVVGCIYLFLGRTAAFVSLVSCNLVLIITNLSRTESLFKVLRMGNSALYAVVGGTAAALSVIILNSDLRNLFHFQPLTIPALTVSLFAGLIILVWFEIPKLLYRRS